MGNRNKGKLWLDPKTQSKVENVNLPPKIKCERCLKHLGQAQFSTNQLNQAKYAVFNDGVNARYKITCQRCTGGGVLVEITCIMCGNTKGMEEFAKAQRKKPDNAKCFLCIENQLEQNPVDDESYEDPRNAYIPLESAAGAGAYPDYFGQSSAHSSTSNDDNDDGYESDDRGGLTLGSGFQKLSIGDSKTGTLIETDSAIDASVRKSNADRPIHVLGGNNWQVSKAESWHTRSVTTSVASGFNPTKYGHPGSRATSVSGTSKTFSSNFTDTSESPNVKKGGWAKVKAYKPEKEEKLLEVDDWNSDEEEDEGNDDSDDSDTEI